MENTPLVPTEGRPSVELVTPELPSNQPPPPPPADASPLLSAPMLSMLGGPAILSAISMVDHEIVVKEAQQRELELKQQLSDLGAENVKLKEKVENGELLVKQLQQSLAEATRLLAYVWDWYKGRNPRKVCSFDKKVIEAVATFSGVK